jgi:hypothetical protein
MLKDTLTTLLSVSGYPAVSVLLPTHRTAPANTADPILLKNLLREAQDRLAQEFTARESHDVLARLENLAAGIDHNHNLEGLALFANPTHASFVRVPYPVPARVVVDENFATRDLLQAFNRSVHYYLLKITTEEANLYEGFRDTLYPVVTPNGFPVTMFYPSGNLNPKDANTREGQVREFFNRIDKLMLEVYKSEPLPVVVAGVERNAAYLRQVADRPALYETFLDGNFDKTSDHDLGKQAWPLVANALANWRAEQLLRLKAAESSGKFVAGLGECWRMAQEGRVELLLLDEKYAQPATLNPDGSLTPVDDPTTPGVLDDAADEVAEAVVRTRGQVVFVPIGTLEGHQRIAAVLRY